MKEAGISLNQSLMSYYQSAELTQPSKCTLNYPSPLVPTHLAPILVSGSLIVNSSWDYWLNTTSFEYLTQHVRVITPICYESLGALAWSPCPVSAPHSDGPEGMSQQLYLRWGCRVQICSQRSTRAIDQNHPLCAPFFSRGKASIGKALVPAYLVLVIELG